MVRATVSLHPAVTTKQASSQALQSIQAKSSHLFQSGSGSLEERTMNNSSQVYIFPPLSRNMGSCPKGYSLPSSQVLCFIAQRFISN